MLGCGMGYGPGASVKVWQQMLLPSDELWEGEFNGGCVDEARKNHQLDGIKVLIGDQGNKEVLKSWINELKGGKFDIIIDDGGKF